MPDGYRLPAALLTDAASPADAQVLDRIADDFLKDLDQTTPSGGVPAPGNPAVVPPASWADALKRADAQYRSIYGYQKADRALRDAAIDAAQ